MGHTLGRMDGKTLLPAAVAFGTATALFALGAFVVTRGLVSAALALNVAAGAMLFACAAIWLFRRLNRRSVASAIASVADRLTAAAAGDLSTPVPALARDTLPVLSNALADLFAQVRADFDSVHAMAMYDPVTSLANRTTFRREAERAIQSNGATAPLALIFIDLDRFKSVNDTLGHAHGDQLLGMVASRIRIAVRAETAKISDAARDWVVGRLAGDEFTVLLPAIGTVQSARHVAGCILTALTAPFELAGNQVEIGASIGVAMRPAHGATLTALMRAADVAMYHAKDKGRGQVQVYSDALADKLAERTQLVGDLRSAIVREEFALVFQPELSLKTGQIIAAEALLRWNHPGEGLRMPDAFLAVAEENGLIHAIGDWAIEASAKMLARWPLLGLDHRLSLNISPRQIVRADFFPRMREALTRHNAPLNMLELEITATMATQASDTVSREIAALREQGAVIVIDDFGTGLCNLSLLRRFPIDRIKLHGSVITDIVNDAEARAVTQALIGLIHGFGCTAVAEGVEGDLQLDMLRVMGCDAAQGYAIAAPMSEVDYVAWNQVERSALAG